MSQNYSSGSVVANVTGFVNTGIESISFDFSTTSGTAAYNHFTVPVGKKWTIYKLLLNGSAGEACDLQIDGNIIFDTSIGGTNQLNQTIDLTNTPIELTAGKHISTGSSAASFAKYVTVFYVEEDL